MFGYLKNINKQKNQSFTCKQGCKANRCFKFKKKKKGDLNDNEETLFVDDGTKKENKKPYGSHSSKKNLTQSNTIQNIP